MSITSPAASVVSPDQLLNSLRWRYAVKKFDGTKKIPAAQWAALEEALVLSPSSYGLQALKFFVIENREVRAKLKAASYEQGQIVDADKLVVFAVKKDFGAADVERFVERIAEIRRVPKEALEGYKQTMLRSASLPAEKVAVWLTRQVYIALGVFLTSAASIGVDACPMEGFDKDQYDQILGLPAKGYNAVVIATVGYRAVDDTYATQKKVRFAKEDVIATL